MKIVRWLAEKKYSQIEVTAIACLAVALTERHWFTAAFIFVAGVIVGVICNLIAGIE